MIQVNRIYLIFNRLVTKKFLVDTSEIVNKSVVSYCITNSLPKIKGNGEQCQRFLYLLGRIKDF